MCYCKGSSLWLVLTSLVADWTLALHTSSQPTAGPVWFMFLFPFPTDDEHLLTCDTHPCSPALSERDPFLLKPESPGAARTLSKPYISIRRQELAPPIPQDFGCLTRAPSDSDETLEEERPDKRHSARPVQATTDKLILSLAHILNHCFSGIFDYMTLLQ